MTVERVVICTASVGHGHTGAAHAIAAAIVRLAPAAKVDVIDALADAPGWFTRVYRDGYLATVSALPDVAGWMYDVADRVEGTGRPFMSRLALGLERTAMRKFAASNVLAQADLVICTHFLCARVLSERRLAGGLRAPLVVSVTDQHPHGVWLVRGADRILVASEEARHAAEHAGVEAGRLEVTGIAVSERFSELPDRDEARRRMDLPREGGVILMSCGGLGLCCMEDALKSLLGSEFASPMHVVAVCGRNALLQSRLERVAKGVRRGGPTCTVLGFTDQMPVLMAASDVKVGKPGGMTTAEAACAGLPMVLLRPIPGQEDRNAHRLVRYGAAVLEPDPVRAMKVAAEIVLDGDRTRRMRAGALSFSRRVPGVDRMGAAAVAVQAMALVG